MKLPNPRFDADLQQPRCVLLFRPGHGREIGPARAEGRKRYRNKFSKGTEND
jgi:hypothetical protein